MINAWVFYYDGDSFHFRELVGQAGYDSTDPKHWGLKDDCVIQLVLQQAQFINSWVNGSMQSKHRGV